VAGALAAAALVVALAAQAIGGSPPSDATPPVSTPTTTPSVTRSATPVATRSPTSSSKATPKAPAVDTKHNPKANDNSTRVPGKEKKGKK
jgi:hypothetical protein